METATATQPTTDPEKKSEAPEAAAPETPEQRVLLAAGAGSPQALRAALSELGGAPPNVCDAHGMTPLHHAAYRGDAEAVRTLIDHGADVNFSKHEYKYTALHFAALSGNAELCHALMSAGIAVDAKNSVGRTAAQMAAFVGNHHCVAKINNFVPRASVDRFAPPLPPQCAEPLHRLVTEANLHPIRVALNLKRAPPLVDHLERVAETLALMSAAAMSEGGDKDEVVAFKLHYLAYLAGEIRELRQRQAAASAKEPKRDENGGGGEAEKRDFVEALSKKLLKPGKDGVTCEYQDAFLNEGVRKFPYRQSVVFRQAVCALAQKEAPSTLSVVDAAVNGQRGFASAAPRCSTCGEEKPAKKCSKCKSVQYCDRECQRLHWFVHKKACGRLASVPQGQAQQQQQPRPEVDAAELSAQLQDLVAREPSL